MDLEEFKIALPQYLSEKSQRQLFSELQAFPNNIDDRMYQNHAEGKDFFLQGDGLPELLFINLPNTETKNANCMLFSNTCDVSLDNKRFLSPRLVYAPILKLRKYVETLYSSLVATGKESKRSIDDHVAAIKKQRVTQFFYLPPGQGLQEESFVPLDTVCSCSLSAVDVSKTSSCKLFTLSDYGFYLFIFKLSVHFTRLQESVDRGN